MSEDPPPTTPSVLEAWVREELRLAPGQAVTITEKPGTDPRCADMVTEVAVGGPGGDPFAFHVERPLAEVTRMDLLAGLAFGGSH
jgi:hypothetical protein